MTPAQINTAARQRYNAVGDSFWSDDEIFYLIYQACLELSTDALLIEDTFTTTSVVGQQEYDYPANAISIKRVAYDGRKLAPFSFREDDVLTVLNQNTTDKGTPTSYAFWDNTFYLRPTPGTTGLSIKVFAYVRPSVVTLSSTLQIAGEWHMDIVNFVLSEMNAKNKNYQGATYYRNLWASAVQRAKIFADKKKRGDAFPIVKDVDVIMQTQLGNY